MTGEFGASKGPHLLLWEEREVVRSEMIASLKEARASIARGDGRIITQASMQALADEAKQRLRSRLAAEQPPVGWMAHRLPRRLSTTSMKLHGPLRESGSPAIAER
jgi:hypothetical protein